jgi:hypothetical protein
MHRELEWPVSNATCLYKKLYMVYSFLYTIIEGTSTVEEIRCCIPAYRAAQLIVHHIGRIPRLLQ